MRATVISLIGAIDYSGLRSAPPMSGDGDPVGEPVTTRVHIDRNGLCPCGSGKKYKKCCRNKAKDSHAR
jgi:hypothetical protein